MTKRKSGSRLKFVAALVLLTAAVSANAQDLSYLYGFAGKPDGENPVGPLLVSPTPSITGDRVFYGSTGWGGAYNNGTIYKVTATGDYEKLYDFPGGQDGVFPSGPLTRDANGNLYGTTQLGGTYNLGIVYKLTPQGQLTVVHAFTGDADGSSPWGGVVRDANGNLFGTAAFGGFNNDGTVFKITPEGDFSVLHRFNEYVDGSTPYGTLAFGPDGYLYGTTAIGGTTYWAQSSIFRISVSGAYTAIYNFAGPDGNIPFGGLLGDGKGNFYGITTGGGTNDNGVVFQVNSAGQLRVLHKFTGGTDGRTPMCRLALDPSGNVYGTTLYGGADDAAGTIFKVTPQGEETILYNFNGTDGGSAYAGVVWAPSTPLGNGALYGPTRLGGPSGLGGVFKLTGF